MIIAYIDMMLISVIKSSSHTAPQKQRIQVNIRYPESLGTRWKFEDESNDRRAEAEEEDEYDKVDVVNIGGRVMVRSPRH